MSKISRRKSHRKELIEQDLQHGRNDTDDDSPCLVNHTAPIIDYPSMLINETTDFHHQLNVSALEMKILHNGNFTWMEQAKNESILAPHFQHHRANASVLPHPLNLTAIKSKNHTAAEEMERVWAMGGSDHGGNSTTLMALPPPFHKPSNMTLAKPFNATFTKPTLSNSTIIDLKNNITSKLSNTTSV